MTEVPAPIQGERPDTPDAMAQGIERALEKDPDRRWQTAAELMPAIESGLGGCAMVDAPGRRRRRPWIAVVAAGLRTGGRCGTRCASRPLARRAMLVAGQTKQLTFDAGLELDPAISPDGQMLAYIAGGPEAGELYVKQRDGDRPVQPAPTLPRPQRSPKWSPDGTPHRPADPGRASIVIPALGGTAQLVPGSDSGGPLFGLDWSPDGPGWPTRAGASSTSPTWSRGDGGCCTRGAGTSAARRRPAWSPDGRAIAFIVENADFVYGSVGNFANFAPTRLALVTLADSAETTLVDDGAMNLSPQWLPDGRGLLFVSNRAGGRDIYRLPLTRAGMPRPIRRNG